MLAPYAVHVENSRGRRFSEPQHPYRNDFQRDRDRVIHARAFRRLEAKTQVFTRRYSDHFRNRLTHTLEVSQVSRTIAGALGLNVDLAETLTQECFLKAHRNWAGFRGESSALTWLMRIAINVQKDHWRNRRLQFWRTTRTNAVDVDEAGEWLPSGESSPEQQLLAREKVAKVWEIVKRLSGRQRMVFLLRYVEEMEIAEIAGATGLSDGTVKAHLSRALGRVRAELGGRA